MQKEKSYTAQTVRLPKSLEKAIGHLQVETGESFQALVMRLLDREVTQAPDVPERGVMKPNEGATIRVPSWLWEELDQEIRKYPRGERPSRGDLLAKCWQDSRTTVSDSTTVPEVLDKIPNAVLKIIAQYWGESDFVSCVFALEDVWKGGGATDIKEVFVRSCAVFRRMAELGDIGRDRDKESSDGSNGGRSNTQT